ncbi:class I SAM-dependent methyltransferase [Arthrobacter sp. NIO-1057]|uniref:class I SAM-dependent methyltransferase n=1 Tax=Arthrobacter sp. NIO-1057 TaxID=993071 RepID=UPI00071C7452|nr:class I SAM-dependent methyltransferase [Arthrobacter sp. NIO-1057]KSU67666.1 methyltransferase [Arthrobacter sp. NIO-1057]SCB75297.1 Methyltransferase domain-containing protein [Arthrobacter sp. NIO-1057]
MNDDSNYDDFAQDYVTENESSLLNAYYERPAMLELAGEVTGRRILDIGCGAGPLTEQLLRRGAQVSGFDASTAMIDLARERLGTQADLKVARLGEALPYPNDSFDDAVASLVFHYLPDWTLALSEVRRVLKPGGRLILSVNHPFLYPFNHRGTDYFKLTKYTDDVTLGGKLAQLTYWHRPLHETMTALLESGFIIDRVWEPPYVKDAPPEVVPEQLRERDAFLSFLFFALHAS